MGDPGTSFNTTLQDGHSASLDATPSSAAVTITTATSSLPSQISTATFEGGPKPKPSFLRDLRRIPSANNMDSSNATTSWTVGQQNIQSRVNSSTPVQQNNNSNNTAAPPPPFALASPATTTALVRPTLASRESEGGQSQGSTMNTNTQDPHSAKSKFMRFFQVFHKRTIDHRKQQPPRRICIRRVVPFGQVESIENTTDQGSVANVARSDVSSASMRSSYAEPSSTARPREPAPTSAHDVEMVEPVKQRRVLRIDPDRSGHSSLRAKFKNQVSNTLASIKSSSNLREKARSQASSSATSPVTPTSTTTQDHQGSNVSADSEPFQSSTSKNRHSKGFWTFPRIKQDSQVAQALRATAAEPTSPEQPSLQPPQAQDLDTIMLSPELAPLTQIDDGEDSDDSIDIIMPGDYDDYTQFAELPLKKRKKLEAAAAAAAAAALNPASKRTQGMKRFLTHPKNAAEGDKGKQKSTDHSSSLPTNSNLDTSVIPQKNSRKRPKDQDSIEQRMRQEPNKMAKSNSEEPSEWRKAIMRSLHLGRRNPAGQGTSLDNTSSQLGPASVDNQDPAHSWQRDSVVYPEDQGPHTGRHESTQSVRSKSLATSTHPGLLATTISKVRAPGSRRETLEMAMRRRRRSSAARSSIFDSRASLHVPGDGLAVIDDDNASANITHTFTSFTLELTELHHAHAVVNNSATPGLFNFKRQSMAFLPAADAELSFRGFDSDGDALSGYTGDADVSMEEIFVRPKTPVVRSSPEGKDKGKAREVSAPDLLTRRKMSSVEGESDTVPELPTLSIRTRDLNKSSGGGRASGRESPRSPRKAGATSPTLHRKPSRNFLNNSYVSSAGTPSPGQLAGNPPSTDEISSWKQPRNILQARPPVPPLNTKQLFPMTKGSGPSSSTTLIPSSRTPYSVATPILTQSFGLISPLAGLARQESLHHQRNSSSYSSSQYAGSGHHRQQTSSDTLLPHHLKNFSTASTMSAGSAYSAQTLLGGNAPGLPTSQPVEFDPSQEFPPTTPVDLKAMDFDTLLKAAEREQQKGSDDLRIKKRKNYQLMDLQALKERHNELSAHARADSDVIGRNTTPGLYPRPLNPKSSLTALVKSAPNLDELCARGTENNNNNGVGGTSRNGNGKLGAPTSRAEPLRLQTSRSGITFDVDENAVAAAAAAPRGNSPRSRSNRVMKKKMSVIKLSGNVQGRREDDGVIRVSVSSPNGDFRQGRAY
ncbi:hypothetical protein BGX23_003260 [Mortierella sp. AD031]|nr:hypothetical protein BGX23_003260 [Mortierella sp. AD031]